MKPQPETLAPRVGEGIRDRWPARARKADTTAPLRILITARTVQVRIRVKIGSAAPALPLRRLGSTSTASTGGI